MSPRVTVKRSRDLHYVVFVYVLFVFFDVTVSIFIKYSLNLLISVILQ